MPNNVMSRNALVVCTDNPLLCDYRNRLRAQSLVEREYYQRLIDHSDAIIGAYSKGFPIAERQIADLKRLIALRTKGAPMTEELDVSSSVNTNQQEAVAHAFLLQKAYRAAAKLAHPDKGGNDADFAAVNAAYKARDLDSLNEFFLSKNRTLVESIQHWRNEVQKPRVQWQEFQSAPTFKVVRFHKSGKTDDAKQYMDKLLQLHIVQLLHELSS